MDIVKTFNLSSIKEIAKMLLETSNTKFILFHGDMGVGKTTLIQTLVSELGGKGVTSPTFSIVNEYEVNNSEIVYHFDFFRINNENEVYDIGIEDYFYTGHWIFIEWPEKVKGILPKESDNSYIKLNIDGSRTIHFEPFNE